MKARARVPLLSSLTAGRSSLAGLTFRHVFIDRDGNRQDWAGSFQYFVSAAICDMPAGRGFSLSEGECRGTIRLDRVVRCREWCLPIAFARPPPYQPTPRASRFAIADVRVRIERAPVYAGT